MLLHRFLRENQGCLLVPCLRHVIFEDIALMVDRPSEAAHLPINLHEHLAQVPTPMAGFQTLDPPFPDLGCERRAEPMPPETNRLMAHIDAALVQQVFDVSE